MKWFNVFNNNLKRSINKKKNFLVTLLLPIFVVVLGIFANYISQPSFNVGVLKAHQNVIAESVIQTLKDTKGIAVEFANPDTLQSDIIIGKYSAVVEFSDKDNFVLYSVKDQDTMNNLDTLINSYIKSPVPLDSSTLLEPTLGIAQKTIAFIVLFLMITSTVTASLIIEDKNSGTFQRFLYSPQKSRTYIIGNILFNFTITYFQFFVSITMITLFKLDIGISYPNLLFMGIWIVALTTSFGTCIASLFKKEMYANLSSTCIALILSLIGGTFIPFDKMPPLLQNASVISPIRWFISATSYMEQGNGWFSGTNFIVILSLFIIALFIIANMNNIGSEKQ